jgi:flagellar motility protein MotE (MotC chaperone)
MKKLAANRIFVLVLGLLMGVGTGVGWFWINALPLVHAARLARAKAGEPVKPEAPWDFWTIEMQTLAKDLQDEKDALKKREDELLRREARFDAERQELNKQRQQLEALQTEIANRVVEIQSDELKNLKTLAATYSNLSPKAMLNIFKEMDDVSVVKLLALMKTDVVSPLFEEMSKQAAADPAVGKRVAHLSEKLRLYRSARTAAAP